MRTVLAQLDCGVLQLRALPADLNACFMRPARTHTIRAYYMLKNALYVAHYAQLKLKART